MEFAKIYAPSLKDLFIRQLEDMILSGKLEIGTQLPSERELSEKMCVSRTIVNAGIAEMAGKGFLDIRPRVGVFVNDFRRQGKVGAILSIMNYNGGSLRRAEIRSILEIRMAFDLLSIDLIVDKATDAEIETLEPFLEKLKEGEDPSSCAKSLFEFHHELCLITQNTLLPLIYSSFSIPIISLWERYCRLYGCRNVYLSTLKTYTLVKERKGSEAKMWTMQYFRAILDGPKQIYGE
ncbi:GntR family transcriptional regulator [uncultured Sphaerochaeta sp.]|uniref:FadR/GntR family transcriptional regulator n=1 Tax=uncultured Sphaerochaeta sp. TaxID=886478 RepID=UPI002A0A327E|nr:GntR family transcriptional regulator [uncultured Sphaerochaeta sp.]